MGKRLLLEFLLMIKSRYVAEGHENGIAGMVMALVKAQQLLVAQIRDVIGLPAAIKMIGRSREYVFADGLP